MNPSRRVGALYSKGPHFLRLLAFLRRQYPNAVIVAVVPPGYPEESLRADCDEIVHTSGGRGLGALRSMAGLLRSARLDTLVLMFHSPRLRVLAALSGIRDRHYFTADGRYLPISMNFAGDAFSAVIRNIQGRWTYYRILWIIRTQRTGK